MRNILQMLILLKMKYGQPVGPHGKYAYLYIMVKNLAKKANIPMPKVVLLDFNAPNAVSAQIEQGYIGITTGLLRELNKSEVYFTLAHEIGHLVLYNKNPVFHATSQEVEKVLPYVKLMLVSLALGAGSTLWTSVAKHKKLPLMLLLASMGGVILSNVPDIKVAKELNDIKKRGNFPHNNMGRYAEIKADEIGVKLTKDPDEAIKTLKILSKGVKACEKQVNELAQQAKVTSNPLLINLTKAVQDRLKFILHKDPHPALKARIKHIKQEAMKCN